MLSYAGSYLEIFWHWNCGTRGQFFVFLLTRQSVPSNDSPGQEGKQGYIALDKLAIVKECRAGTYRRISTGTMTGYELGIVLCDCSRCSQTAR